MNVAELKRSAAQFLQQAQALISRSQVLDRDLTEEEHAEADELIAKAEAYDAHAKSLERADDQAARLAVLTTRPRPRTLQGPQTLTPGQMPGPQGARRGKTCVELFGAPDRDNWGDSSQDFLRAVSLGLFDERLQPFAAAMGEGSGSAGGYAVPQQLAYAILDSALHMEIVRPRADVHPMISQNKLIAAYDGLDQDPTASLYGFTFQWLSENQNVTPGGGQMRAIMLQAKLGGIYLSASNELAADALDFESSLNERLMVAVAHNLDYYFLLGTGAGQPLGALRGGCVITQAAESGQGQEVLLENVTNMFARSSSPQNSIWVSSPTCLPSLLGMTMGIPGGPSPAALTVGADGSMSLLTRPLLLSSKLPTVGNKFCLSFCDFQYYAIGLRKEVGLEKSSHAGFTSNSTVFRALVRVDGQPKTNSAYIGEDAQSYSPFVTLGTV
jgi:HK97 family phage major capsid protein